jgi:hypothetical protein
VFFSHLDGEGRLLLADLVVHETTPFAEIARSSERIVFVDSGELVGGRIVEVDWDTQHTLRAYPANRPVLTPAAGWTPTSVLAPGA